ncbi:hypothetical protein [Mangrovibacterium sp.]|uniref:hypothetical protein n=1 Tax=Mangrovibacterium sp. TaxID=1961364 RepID=UPI003561A94A
MDYLKSALELKQLIRKVNHLQTQKETSVLAHRNSMFLFSGSHLIAEQVMAEFTNEFVQKTLAVYPNATSFVMTDLAATKVKEKTLTYWLYKGYHTGLEKGMVYYQPIDEQSLNKIGRLQYSNLEDNIFLKHSAPDFEESSANAMETEEQIEGSKSIVFFIGNMDETRLLYDIQRVIFDTLNNVQNHKNLNFRFILNITRFGGKTTTEFLAQLKDIEHFVKKELEREYPNVRYVFDLEK